MSDTIVVRHPRFDFQDLPRHWLAGSRPATWFGNAGHVFIPLGEEFFIDAVRACRGAVGDPALRRDINAFIGQESVHKRAHEAMWETLRGQGVPVDAYQRFITSVRSLERFVPARVQLAVTAALEHYTAAFGYAFLTEDLGEAVPDEMARLLAWHGLEELEHRAVAFDVLRTVDDRYLLRVGGFAIATALLIVVPGAGVVLLALHDRPGNRGDVTSATRPARRELWSMTRRFVRTMGQHTLEYLRPGFHPHDMALPAEAATWSAILEQE